MRLIVVAVLARHWLCSGQGCRCLFADSISVLVVAVHGMPMSMSTSRFFVCFFVIIIIVIIIMIIVFVVVVMVVVVAGPGGTVAVSSTSMSLEGGGLHDGVCLAVVSTLVFCLLVMVMLLLVEQRPQRRQVIHDHFDVVGTSGVLVVLCRSMKGGRKGRCARFLSRKEREGE